MRFLFFFLCLGVMSLRGQAQDISTRVIRWNSDRSFETSQGESIDEATTMTSYEDRLEWRNADGTVRKIYAVIALVQGWSDISVPGKARFQITDDGYGGVVVFERTTMGIRIIITVAKDTPESFEIDVHNYQTL